MKHQLSFDIFSARWDLDELLADILSGMGASIHAFANPFDMLGDEFVLVVKVGKDVATTRIRVTAANPDITDRVAEWLSTLPRRFRASYARPGLPWPDCLPDMFDNLQPRNCLCPLLGYDEHEECCVYSQEPEVEASYVDDLPPMFAPFPEPTHAWQCCCPKCF